MKKNEVEQAVTFELPKIDIKFLTVDIIGDSPLIVHAWSEKAKREMLDAQQGKKTGKKKEFKNPVAESGEFEAV